MFKKYRFNWETADGGKRSLDFFVHSKARKSGGLMHRAVAIGAVPRLDEEDADWRAYKENEEKLFHKRFKKVLYEGRTWECYPGQTCLSELWEQMAELKFTDMTRISKVNPFSEHGGEFRSQTEPEHEDLWEPEELFDRFTGRR